MCIETISGREYQKLNEALNQLKRLIETELSGECTGHILNSANPEVVIDE